MRINPITLNMAHGFYARILVDVDLTKALPDRNLVKTTEVNFFASIAYKRLPEVCLGYGSIGYTYAQCRN